MTEVCNSFEARDLTAWMIVTLFLLIVAVNIISILLNSISSKVKCLREFDEYKKKEAKADSLATDGRDNSSFPTIT